MATSSAATVEEYLAALPEERRAVVARVRDVVRGHLPPGYEEGITFGMIGWSVPLARYPDTYNGQPLGYLALAAQKSHYALYLCDVNDDPERATWLRAAFARAGRKLDMGKSCLRFRRLEDLPLEVIGEFVAARPVDTFVARHEAARAASNAGR